MTTLYKKSNTEEDFNEKRIKDNHSQKTPHLYLLARMTPYYVLVTLRIKLVFEKYVFKASHWSGLYGKILHM